MKKICEYCGEEFETNRGNKIYCNKKCKQLGVDKKRRNDPVRKEYNKNKLKEFKDRNQDYDKNYRKNNPDKVKKWEEKRKTDPKRIEYNKNYNIEYRQRPEVIKQIKEYRKKPEVIIRETNRRWKRKGIKNMTMERYYKMFKEQNGNCGICGINQKDLNHKLNIDHCHKTGFARMLLCCNCNRGLGYFKDNPDILASATSYLQQDYTYA